MSDIEDMDVDMDQPAKDDSVTFSAIEKGKKLSKADLPTQAGDTLPWCVGHIYWRGRKALSITGTFTNCYLPSG